MYILHDPAQSCVARLQPFVWVALSAQHGGCSVRRHERLQPWPSFTPFPKLGSTLMPSLTSAPQAQHGGGPALPLSSGAGLLHPSSGSWLNLPLVAELDDAPGGALRRASLSQIFNGDAAF